MQSQGKFCDLGLRLLIGGVLKTLDTVTFVREKFLLLRAQEIILIQNLSEGCDGGQLTLLQKELLLFAQGELWWRVQHIPLFFV
jgi:hypothetical protein